jgi:hypothetical protein
LKIYKSKTFGNNTEKISPFLKIYKSKTFGNNTEQNITLNPPMDAWPTLHPILVLENCNELPVIWNLWEIWFGSCSYMPVLQENPYRNLALKLIGI